jgi:hypothetical protein
LGDQPAVSDPSPSPTSRGDIDPFTYILEPHSNISIFVPLNTPYFYPPSLLQTFSALAYLSDLSITVPIKGEDASLRTTCCWLPNVSRQYRSAFNTGELTGVSIFAQVLAAAVIVIVVAYSHHYPSSIARVDIIITNTNSRIKPILKAKAQTNTSCMQFMSET